MKIDRVDNKDVWRDDLLYGGTKTLFIKRYIERRRENFDEFVYASPRVGYGQIALSVVCNQLGCKSSIFIPRGELTEISKKCIEISDNFRQFQTISNNCRKFF